MPSISIVGSGNVAWAMGKQLLKSNWEIKQVIARNKKEGTSLAKTLAADFAHEISELAEPVDVILLAVKDAAIKEMAKKIPPTSAVVIHCSGSTPLDVIPNQRRAALWPMQSIFKKKQVDWSSVNVILEANEKESSFVAQKLIKALGAKVVMLSAEQRSHAHLIAVLLNNFTNHLYHMADVLCEQQGIDRQIFDHLASSTPAPGEKAIDRQTGPAKRRELEVITRQIDQLKKMPHFATVYKALSQSIIEESNEL